MSETAEFIPYKTTKQLEHPMQWLALNVKALSSAIHKITCIGDGVSLNAVMAPCRKYSLSPATTSIKTFHPLQLEAQHGIVRYCIHQLDKPQDEEADKRLVDSRIAACDCPDTGYEDGRIQTFIEEDRPEGTRDSAGRMSVAERQKARMCLGQSGWRLEDK